MAWKKSAEYPEYCLLIPTRGVMIDNWAAEDPELKFYISVESN